ncbi:hypothetical protein FORC22_3748 [Vibrio parahaemolyticus]|nr:hypothetical protein FORC22_3748 [Vibrio parahaemolyticus]
MTNKKTRIKHSPEFKAEAQKLAENVDVAVAARQLGCTNTSSKAGVRHLRRAPVPINVKKIWALKSPSSKGNWLSK